VGSALSDPGLFVGRQESLNLLRDRLIGSHESSDRFFLEGGLRWSD
jgi:hypothetical protein